MDAMEILVQLKDLSEGAFKKVEGNLTHLEQKANSTNLGGVSKATKAMEKDAESAAGKKGLGGLLGGLTGLVNPAMLAATAVGAVVGILGKAEETAADVIKQEDLLDIAYKAHGSTLDAQRGFIEDTIKANEQYGQGADATRAAILELVQAGHSQADVVASMPQILMLAQQKHVDLATAAKMVQLAEMGNAKALKDLGIILPKTALSTADLAKATRGVTVAHSNLISVQDKLAIVEEQLRGKHHLTATEALRLKTAHDKVTAAALALKAANEKLSLAQQGGINKGVRQNLVLGALHSAFGDATSAAKPLDVAQAKLGDTWQKLAMVIGPPVMKLFSWLIDAIANLVGWIADAVTWVGHLAGSFNAVLGPIGAVLGAIGNIAGFVGGAIGSILPHFAGGGVIEPRAGGTVAVLGEGGEREYVIPESKMGSVGGRSPVVVHTHLYIDGRSPRRWNDTSGRS